MQISNLYYEFLNLNFEFINCNHTYHNLQTANLTFKIKIYLWTYIPNNQ